MCGFCVTKGKNQHLVYMYRSIYTVSSPHIGNIQLRRNYGYLMALRILKLNYEH